MGNQPLLWGDEAVSANASIGARRESVQDIRDRFKGIHNYIYANDRFKQQSKVFEEIVKLLLTKLYYERETSDIPQDDDAAAEHLKASFTSAIIHLGVQSLFGDGESLSLAPRVLAYAFNQLKDIPLTDTDAKGAAFQAIIGPQTRGEKGQFFTPDPVKRLMIQILDPQRGERILDPACGSGGLLALAINHLRSKERKGNGRFAGEFVFGIEVDPAVARMARLNMAFQGVGLANIYCGDALSPLSQIEAFTSDAITKDSIDIVVTNPPFGTKGKVDDPRILEGFPNVAGGRGRQVPDILFLERCVQLLKPGGRAGIVLPFGDLANSSLNYVRDFLRRTCHIFAVITLPPPTFKPAENSVKAAVLFIQKWNSTKRPKRYPTFRAVSEKIGYDMHERPVYKRNAKGEVLSRDGAVVPGPKLKDAGWMSLNALIDEDISEIIQGWNEFRAEYGGDFLW